MYQKFRTILLTVFALVAAMSVSAQEVKWTSSVEHVGGEQYRILLEAAIPSGYHMYDMGPYEFGANPTIIKFTPSAGVELVGGVKQLTKPHKVYDDILEIEIGQFDGKAKFAQLVKLTAAKASVNTYLEWMICNDNSCMPLTDTEMTIELKAVAGAAPAAEKVEESAAAPVEEVAAAEEAAAAPAEEVAAAEEVKAEAAPEAEVNEAAAEEDGGSIWALIIEAIIWGFAALLTPCVFPMVPMTVSYFLKGEGGVAMGRLRAALYGIFIVALYTLPIAAIIVITRVVGGDAVTADIFNRLATHWLPNILFFLVFMVFAASFFGAFEITMPSWMVNKADSKADTKGLGGIFFLALTLVLVSFSCTGPIVGSVLIKSTSGEFWTPIITMLAFSTAFALPFTLFALFPSILKNLPKSGGWLNSVKVVIGFVEVALGMKFLSVADQTYHWGLLDREIYLAVWIVVFSLMGLYLLGKIKFSHDSDLPYIGVGRLALAIVVFSFVVYMIPGMWGAPLKGLSGYMPPLATQDFVLSAGGSGSAVAGANDEHHICTVDGKAPKYSDFLHLPHGLVGFFDMKEAEAYAAKVGKPIFIDFTGHGCVNCREMEARVWSDPEVLRILRDEYVIVALYVDDKKELPESEWVTTDAGKVLKGLGKINSHYALTKYGVNAQPYYVLQGADGQTLVEPRKYDLDVAAFVDFLKKGVEAYKAAK